jgi:hypothetical protein
MDTEEAQREKETGADLDEVLVDEAHPPKKLKRGSPTQPTVEQPTADDLGKPFRYGHGFSNFIDAPRGLPNNSNKDCWINTMLQLIRNIRPLRSECEKRWEARKLHPGILKCSTDKKYT